MKAVGTGSRGEGRGDILAWQDAGYLAAANEFPTADSECKVFRQTVQTTFKGLKSFKVFFSGFGGLELEERE
jgi:hypothetical protein